MMEISVALDTLVPASEYQGSLTDNTELAYDSIIWLDSRPKPSWQQIMGVPEQDRRTLNTRLEDKLKELLPKHQTQPYFTPDVIDSLVAAKVKVTEANLFDPSGMMGKAVLVKLNLPVEMQGDKLAILALFP